MTSRVLILSLGLICLLAGPACFNAQKPEDQPQPVTTTNQVKPAAPSNVITNTSKPLDTGAEQYERPFKDHTEPPEPTIGEQMEAGPIPLPEPERPRKFTRAKVIPAQEGREPIQTSVILWDRAGGMNARATQLGTFPEGTEVRILGEAKEFLGSVYYQVEINGKTGWVDTRWLSME